MKVINKDTSHEKWKAVWYLLIILGSMTVGALVIQTVARYYSRRTTDILSINMRSETFKTLVKQPIQFFDAKSNSIGSLVGTLASDIRYLNGNSVEFYLIILQGMSALLCGIIIAFCYSWRLALFMTMIAPFLCLGFLIQYQLQFTPPNKSKSSKKKQLIMVSDCIMNYQTIASLAYEDDYLEKYGVKSSANRFNVGLFNSEYITMKNAFLISIIYGLSQAAIPASYCIGMLSFIERTDSGKSMVDQVLAYHACLYGCFVLGNGMMNSPNFAKGKMVAAKILSIIEKPKEGTEASPIKDGSETLTKNNASMDIVFRNVWFKYPLESSKWVMRNFNLTIKGGQKIGLIGESGCGKSTIVQLLLRFYDPQEGEITIGGINIQELTISSLRSMFGLVQQEPVLFNTSIMENVIYGKPDANAQEIVRATKMANAHDFICTLKDNPDEVDPNADIVEDARYSSLEDGYRSLCGSRGSKLSGGQKQRIAIARALVRDPPILLLDEATSALDEKSQREVQEALDSLTINKTCIIIAHRVSTLKKCDKIYEVAEGTILS